MLPEETTTLGELWRDCWLNNPNTFYNSTEIYNIYNGPEVSSEFLRMKNELRLLKKNKIRKNQTMWLNGIPKSMWITQNDVEPNWSEKFKIKLKTNGTLFTKLFVFFKFFSRNFNYTTLALHRERIKAIYLVPLIQIRKKRLLFKINGTVCEQEIISSCTPDYHKGHANFENDLAYGFVVLYKHGPLKQLVCRHFCVNKCEWENIYNGYQI